MPQTLIPHHTYAKRAISPDTTSSFQLQSDCQHTITHPICISILQVLPICQPPWLRTMYPRSPSPQREQAQQAEEVRGLILMHKQRAIHQCTTSYQVANDFSQYQHPCCIISKGGLALTLHEITVQTVAFIKASCVLSSSWPKIKSHLEATHVLVMC